MKVKVVWLDDDESFTKTVTYNISSLKSTFFQALDTDITEIEVITACEPEEAFEIINNKENNIELLIVDIELKYEKEGHEEYDKLFYQGKAIPAIVVSAYANTPKRIAEIRSKGISVIIDKLREENLEEEIARQICFVLGNSAERILQLRAAVERLRIHQHTIKIREETKTIEECFRLLVSGEKMDIEEEIRQGITDECIRNFRMEDDHSPGFTHQEL